MRDATGRWRLALWLGLVTGLGELGYLGLRKFVRHLFVFASADVLWMTPLATALLFLLVTALLLPLLRRRADGGQGLLLGVLGTMLAASWLLLFPPLHRGAALVIAIGLGVQLARVAGLRRELVDRITRSTLPLLLGLLLLAGITVPARRWWQERGARAALPAARAGAPNVLLLVLDTVRAMNLSLYGYARPTTPTLVALGRKGTRFDWALSTAPWTLPSHASLLTGTWPHQQTTDWYQPLSGGVPTLAEVLGRAGYRSAGIVANVSYTSRETGLARGFTHYDDYPVTPAMVLTSASLIRTVVNLDQVRSWVGSDQLISRRHAADINAAFLRWVDADRGRPFFGFLNYLDAHTPYLPPDPAWRARFVTPGITPVPNLERHSRPDAAWPPEQVQGAMDAYDGALGYLDEQLGVLFGELERRGLLENTLVVITSDHGEEFNEHGLIHHGNSLYLPSVHVPLLLFWPGRVPAGDSVLPPVSLRDVPATIMDLLAPDGAAPFPGRSLARFWQGTTQPDDTLLSELKFAPQQPAWYPASKGDMVSAVQRGQRYIHTGDGREELFDFGADPLEQHDLRAAPEGTEGLARFRQLLHDYVSRPR